MTGRINGKVALVTGASGGIGAAIVELFLREGARAVVATDVSDGGLSSLAEHLSGVGEGQLRLIHLDVSSQAEWTETLATVQREFGALDILINVAGILDWPGIEDTDEDGWNRVIAINQTGTWLGMKTAMPLLKASGQGSIVNTSSILGIIGSGAAAAYQASKGAVRILTKTAAVEYAKQGVRVNSVHPGVVATPMIEQILAEQGDQQPDIVRTPMARAGLPTEIAPAYLYLASDEASFVTGAEFVIDGGLTAY